MIRQPSLEKEFLNEDSIDSVSFKVNENVAPGIQIHTRFKNENR